MPRNNQCGMQSQYNGNRCKSNVMIKNKIYNMQICYFHSNYLFAGPARCVQNIYRNNKIRGAINIYKNLPQDLQEKILFYIQENDLIKKHHHNVIEKIIIKRCNHITHKRNNIDIINNQLPIFIKGLFGDVNDIFKLIMKYKNILSYRTHHLLSIEIGMIDQYLLNIHIDESFGLENAIAVTTDNLMKSCIDINYSKFICKINNKKTNNWHQLYADNINSYHYYI